MIRKEQFVASLRQSKKWVPMVERPICFLIKDLILRGELSSVFNQALGSIIPPIGDTVVRDFVFSPIEAIENTSQAIQSQVKQSGYRSLSRIGGDCQRRANELHNYLLANQNDELTHRLIQFRDLYTRVTPYLLLVLFAEKFLEQEVGRLIKEKVGEEDQRYFGALVSVKKFNDNTEELIAIIRLAKQIKEQDWSLDDPRAKNLINDHVEHFGWLATRWQMEESWTADDIKSRIKNYLALNPDQELAKVLRPRTEAEEVTKEFVEHFKLNQEERDFIDLVKEFVYLRTFRSENLARANFLVKPTIKQAAKELGLTEREIINLSIDEIVAALAGASYRPLVEARHDGYYAILFNDQIEIFTGDEKKVVDQSGIFNFPGETTGQEISGQIGWRGCARGPVKIVRSEADIKEVKPGDVLVAIMTFPNYVPAMEKATAFVTNEGGILCHAAIIAREMQKPCIIGTKIATQVLKDGDLVEVDAEKGIVKIVKKVI